MNITVYRLEEALAQNDITLAHGVIGEKPFKVLGWDSFPDPIVDILDGTPEEEELVKAAIVWGPDGEHIPKRQNLAEYVD
jgi:hypothetical protein